MFNLIPYRKNNGLQLGTYDEMKKIWSFMDNFFDNSLDTLFSGCSAIKADIKETEKAYIIEAEIPGVKKEDISLNVSDNNIVITVEQKEEAEEKREHYIRAERRYGSCTRSFYLDGIKEDGISARYENGILTVTAEKDKPKNKKVEIQ